VTGCNGPIYRNSHITFAGVTDGLSNTVFAGEKTPFLADATWVGIIPGYRHFAYNAFASLGTGGLGVSSRANKGDELNYCGKMTSLRGGGLPGSFNLPRELRMPPLHAPYLPGDRHHLLPGKRRHYRARLANCQP